MTDTAPTPAANPSYVIGDDPNTITEVNTAIARHESFVGALDVPVVVVTAGAMVPVTDRDAIAASLTAQLTAVASVTPGPGWRVVLTSPVVDGLVDEELGAWFYNGAVHLATTMNLSQVVVVPRTDGRYLATDLAAAATGEPPAEALVYDHTVVMPDSNTDAGDNSDDMADHDAPDVVEPDSDGEVIIDVTDFMAQSPFATPVSQWDGDADSEFAPEPSNELVPSIADILTGEYAELHEHIAVTQVAAAAADVDRESAEEELSTTLDDLDRVRTELSGMRTDLEMQRASLAAEMASERAKLAAERVEVLDAAVHDAANLMAAAEHEARTTREAAKSYADHIRTEAQAAADRTAKEAEEAAERTRDLAQDVSASVLSAADREARELLDAAQSRAAAVLAAAEAEAATRLAEAQARLSDAAAEERRVAGVTLHVRQAAHAYVEQVINAAIDDGTLVVDQPVDDNPVASDTVPTGEDSEDTEVSTSVAVANEELAAVWPGEITAVVTDEVSDGHSSEPTEPAHMDSDPASSDQVSNDFAGELSDDLTSWPPPVAEPVPGAPPATVEVHEDPSSDSSEADDVTDTTYIDLLLPPELVITGDDADDTSGLAPSPDGLFAPDSDGVRDWEEFWDDGSGTDVTKPRKRWWNR